MKLTLGALVRAPRGSDMAGNEYNDTRFPVPFLSKNVSNFVLSTQIRRQNSGFESVQERCQKTELENEKERRTKIRPFLKVSSPIVSEIGSVTNVDQLKMSHNGDRHRQYRCAN